MSSVPTTQSLPHQPSYLAAFLSFLVPGLGQMMQRRFGKGLLFMVSLLGMFHLGQWMGNWQNVYVARAERGGGFVAGQFARWHYAGQFWIGAAAWPAIVQHFYTPSGFLGLTPTMDRAEFKILSITPDSPAEKAGLKAGDTILSIDDQKWASVDELNNYLRTRLPGAQIRIMLERGNQAIRTDVVLSEPFLSLGNYQRIPEETAVNRFLVNTDKSPDLGWVYTVIAGMLNILVIYDAYAGAGVLGLRPTTKPQTIATPAEAKTAGGPA